MIDYKKYRHLLLTMVAGAQYGFKERKDKTCAKYRVFDNGKDTIIVPSNGGRYELFYCASNESIRGDVFAFVNFCEFGSAQPIDKYQRDRVFEVISKTAAVTIEEVPRLDPYVSVEGSQIGEKKIFGYSKISSNFFPYIAQELFKKRGFNPQIPPIFLDSVGMFDKKIRYNGQKFQQLGFLWRNQNGECLGIQSKFIDLSGRCVKLFEPGSQKGSSVFYTSLKKGSTVLICEDPFDAMAHYDLYKNEIKNIGYICTGGTPSINQVQIINELVAANDLKVLLGNDNDLAGQITNLKILDLEQTFRIVKNQDTSVYVSDRQTGEMLFEGGLWELKSFVVKVAQRKSISVEFPKEKDWNDDLLHCKNKEIKLSEMVIKAIERSTQYSSSQRIVSINAPTHQL